MKALTKTIILTCFSLGIALVVGCSGVSNDDDDGSSTTSGGSLYCSAVYSGSTATSTTVPVTLYASGGTSPYYVTNFTAGGYSPSSVSGSTTFSGSTSLSAIYSTSITTGSSGTITVMDTAGSSTSCYFTVGSSTATTTTTSSSNACSIYASNSYPYLNQSVTFTVQSLSGWGTAPYTFYQFSAGSGTSSGLSQTSTTAASASVTFYAAGTQTIMAYIKDYYGNIGYCSTAVTVNSSSSTSTGSNGCSVSFSQNPAYRGQSVVVTGYSLTGVPLTLNSVYGPTNAGITGSITSTNAATLYFTYAGSFLLTLYMTDAYGQTMSCTGTQTVY